MASRSSRPATAAKRVALTFVALTSASAELAGAAEAAPTDSMQAIAARIATEQATNGPYSLELIDLLRGLALLYEEDGQHALSAAMSERAMQVVRANYGLRSLEQAPFLEQRIGHEESRGNFEGAWDLEQSLLALAAAQPDDLRTVPILREIAAKRMSVAERYAAGELPPQVLLGCFYNPSRNPNFGNCSSGSKGTALRALVADARRYYRGAIDVLVRQGLEGSDEVRELEMLIVRGSYRHGSYWSGRQALHRMFNHGAASSAAWLSRMDAALQVGDWDLAFGQHPSALDLYEQVYGALVTRGVDAAVLHERFGSATPLMVPLFEANPFDPAQAADTDAYIEVSFEITKYGRGRRAKILDATPDATAADRAALLTLIARNRFRPRIVAGEFVDTELVARRYLNAAAPTPRGDTP